MSMKIKKSAGPITLPFGVKIDKIEADLEFETMEEYRAYKEEERKDIDTITEVTNKLEPIMKEMSEMFKDIEEECNCNCEEKTSYNVEEGSPKKRTVTLTLEDPKETPKKTPLTFDSIVKDEPEEESLELFFTEDELEL